MRNQLVLVVGVSIAVSAGIWMFLSALP